MGEFFNNNNPQFIQFKNLCLCILLININACIDLRQMLIKLGITKFFNEL